MRSPPEAKARSERGARVIGSIANLAARCHSGLERTGSPDMTAFDEGPSIWFGVSPAAIDAAREAITEGRPLRSVPLTDYGAGTFAPLIPSEMRIAVFQYELEATVHSAKRAGAPPEAIDALLAVAITLTERFPEAD
jgi:hypothetical protein